LLKAIKLWSFDFNYSCQNITAVDTGMAIKHPVPDWVKPSFLILTSRHS